ncbi:helix-turn-helix domain-containing protein [Novosphingobium humi]|uniref:helix-turn-helix domain-containing protein n=1 Tax=Novosphingobium humi TaxID=2282397 RepID=UPI0025AFD133|nr:helix-turn-helix transcriptional regulator [Novosphingobium humi]WJS99911.1 helix-turn-helix transcriptional regulator [Novosphingobium humi]
METQLELLSEQQKACLRLVAQGMTSKEIGKTLMLSNMTVDDYILAARTKLGGVGRREAAKMLICWESRAPQTLGPQPEALGPQPDRIVPNAMPLQLAMAGQQKPLTEPFSLRLPPIGGRVNDLSLSGRVAGLGKVAFLSALLLVLTIAIITGAIALLR